ncbi:MAG: CHAT domain-containing protein [Pseudomonadota bacterium]
MRRVVAVLMALYTVCSYPWAHASSSGPADALRLGNESARHKQIAEAIHHYDAALAQAGPASVIGIAAALNLVAIGPEAKRAAQLQTLSAQVDALPPSEANAALQLNLGHQAAQLKPPALRLALHHIEQAHRIGGPRLQLEADDAMAALYEDRGRYRESLAMTREAIARAQRMDGALAADIAISLEWRSARLHQRLGNNDAALATYERAVEQLRANRDDMPIEYDNGRSSYSETIAPLHLGYADLLLARAGQEPALLRRVLDAVEQVRQAELQDYLGDRCVVETIQGGKAAPPPAGVAILYPIIFPDRIELLLETQAGIVRRTTRIDSATLAGASNKLAYALRNGMNDYLVPAQQIYDWLLRPFDAELAQASVLVVVPDGALRLLPFSALHDGQRYAIEHYAVSTVTGMTMTNGALSRTRGADALVVGVANPGPVVGKLSQAMSNAIVQPAAGGLAQSRALRALRTGATGAQLEQLRTSLQLPGVKQEVDALAAVLPGKHLLDAQFTVDRFLQETDASDYRIIHIASHGVFGGSAESSFIMAYDDLLTMNGLQRILKADKFTRAPLELLSLSACETAEGNERAPLGISGAAIRARAKSVLGTLWPLEDNAAQGAMRVFYTGLSKGGLSKAEALRQAQLVLLRDPASAHPFFWASFLLIGNWQ